jgi:hypothetical protein
MGIIKTGNKGKHLNGLAKYHLYLISKDNLHMNETYIDTTKYSRPYTDSTTGSSTQK